MKLWSHSEGKIINVLLWETFGDQKVEMKRKNNIGNLK